MPADMPDLRVPASSSPASAEARVEVRLRAALSKQHLVAFVFKLMMKEGKPSKAGPSRPSDRDEG